MAGLIINQRLKIYKMFNLTVWIFFFSLMIKCDIKYLPGEKFITATEMNKCINMVIERKTPQKVKVYC